MQATRCGASARTSRGSRIVPPAIALRSVGRPLVASEPNWPSTTRSATPMVEYPRLLHPRAGPPRASHGTNARDDERSNWSLLLRSALLVLNRHFDSKTRAGSNWGRPPEQNSYPRSRSCFSPLMASNTDIPCGPIVMSTGFPSLDLACTTKRRPSHRRSPPSANGGDTRSGIQIFRSGKI
jgi:hypothetical protein